MQLSLRERESYNERSAAAIFFNKLSSIKSLELNGFAIKHMFMDGLPETLANVLSSFKSIDLYDNYLWLNLEPIIYMSLLRSSPKLEKITIQVEEIENMTTLQAYEILDISFNHHREVKLVKVYGTGLELMLIALLLGKSPNLERM